jgi:hypothetical protein
MAKILIVLIISAFFSLSCAKNDKSIVSDETDSENTDILSESVIIVQSTVVSKDLLNQIVYNGDISELEKLITTGQLSGFSGNELRILRNTIYAKYGYKFNSIDLLDHFSKFHWYNGESNNVDDKLTMVDIENIKLIQEMERRKAEENDAMKNELIGNWYMYGGIANEGIDNISIIIARGEQVQILPDGTYIYFCRAHVSPELIFYGLWSFTDNTFETVPIGEHIGHTPQIHIPTYGKVENFRIETFTFNDGSRQPTASLFNYGMWVKE